MKDPSIEDIMTFRFLSQLKFSPSGGESAHVVTQANNSNGYRHELWLCSADDHLLRLREIGKQKLYAWEDPDHLIFADECSEDKQAQKDRDEVVTHFYRVCARDGETVRAFDIGMKVLDIRPVEERLWLVLGECDRNLHAPKSPARKAENGLSAVSNTSGDCRIMDEVPFWADGRGVTNGKRRGLYLYSEAQNSLAMISPANWEAELHAISSRRRYIAGAGRKMDGVYSEKAGLWEFDRITGTTAWYSADDFYIRDLTYADDELIFNGAEGKTFGYKENGGIYHADRASRVIRCISEFDFTIGVPVNSDCRLGGGITFKAQGEHLYFTSLRGYVCGLYRMHLGSGTVETVYDAAGSTDSFDISGETIRCIAMSGECLQELYALADGVQRRLTDCNVALNQLNRHAKTAHHTIIDHEGVVFDGWAVLPLDYNPKERYPAILHIHGGPKTAFGDAYFHEMQLWAAHGYFVLYCNPRGSDGKGNLFADIRGKYGDIDYENLIQFQEAMLQTYPAIDSERLGVTGGSYGGFMTNWIIGHSNRFRCACSQRSISNWFTFICMSDIGSNFGTDQMQANPWSNPEKLWKHSPLKYADKVNTPTLFVHSDEDYRCGIYEGYQMFTALYMNGVEARMCVFHGENHELSRSGKPENRKRRMSEILSWWDKFLMEYEYE